jgi:DNA-binding NarL/FixJ family response regulator
MFNKSPIRALVADDFQPFRRFIASTLERRSDVQVICEVSDGLEAVQKAQELQPDLVVLDIGLPTLNGIEAARRIRSRSPNSKIVFLTLVSDPDVVREAFSLGARGYVAKTQAGSELVAAVEAVLRGATFVSSSIEPGTMHADRGHTVAFYPDDASFVDGFAGFIEHRLKGGNAAIVVAAGSRRDSILQRLREVGLDMDAAIETGSYVFVDAADMLCTFVVNDLVDPVRFLSIAGDLVTVSGKSITREQPRVALCGECASLLWARGNPDAAIEVEQLCNQLAKQFDVDILCGFSLSSFYREEDRQVFERICREV